MSHEELLTLRQATLLEGGRERVADLRIAGGRIVEIGRLEPEGQVLDLAGLLVLPGIIDAHVHVREPGATHKEDFRSASEAALAGGVTSFLDMPNNQPPTVSLERLEEKRRLASSRCLVHYGFFLGATRENIRELNAIPGVPGVKVYLGSSTGSLLVDDLGDLTRIVAETEKLLVLHAENEQVLRYFGDVFRETALHHVIRDNAAAAVSVAESLMLARRFGKRIHIAHLSTKEEIELLRAHKSSLVTCEACPHHLFLDQDYFVRRGNLGKMNPPLREPGSVQALWAGIRDGLVDIIATDHAPHTLEEKAAEYEKSPCGVPGLETSLPLLLDAALAGRLSLARLQELMCRRPAEIFRMARKGRIHLGYDADLCVVDRGGETVVSNDRQRTRCRWTPFHGRRLRGRVAMTFVKGILKYREGEIVSDRPADEIAFEP
ncbi:MAG: dihydroorotase [Planctomycetes bacterium]|nr:dihydroorotase [Planctomycetota bacterium]